MHLGEISFCDRIGFNIKSDDIKKKILDELEAITGFKVIQKHHERFDPSISPQRINTMPHIVSLRSNGNPYLLYLTRYNYENQCIFIDKKIQHGYFYPRMIMSKLWFDEEIFNNTLLDGEMVKTTTGEWHFLINDIVCMNNKSLDNLNIIRRIDCITDVLKNHYHHDEFSCCRMLMKKYHTISNLEDMFTKLIPSLPYTCRGVYFKPFYLKFRDVLMNFDDNLVQKVVRFKYKHIDGETFKATASTAAPVHAVPQDAPPRIVPPPTVPNPDASTTDTIFYIKKTSNADVYELYQGSHDDKMHSHAIVNTMKTSKMLKDMFRDVNLNERIKMVCSYNEKFGRFIPQQKAIEA